MNEPKKKKNLEKREWEVQSKSFDPSPVIYFETPRNHGLGLCLITATITENSTSEVLHVASGAFLQDRIMLNDRVKLC
jgi:hypothetical protein